MSDYDLGIEWKPEPNEGDKPAPLPFFEGAITTRWDFEDGSYLELEKSDYGYLFGGRLGEVRIDDGNYEDLFFETTDDLLDYLKKNDLLRLLSRPQ